MNHAHLLPRVHTRVNELLNGYVQTPAIRKQIEDYIVLPGLGNQAGVLGGLALAMQAD